MVAEEVFHPVFGECLSAKRDSFSEELSSTRNGANNKSGFKSDKKQKFPSIASYVTRADRSNNVSDSSRTNSCVICMGEHELGKCDRFKQLSQPERYKLVQEHRLCCNCLLLDHHAKDCNSAVACIKCKKNHHILLHIDGGPPKGRHDVKKAENINTVNSYASFAEHSKMPIRLHPVQPIIPVMAKS